MINIHKLKRYSTILLDMNSTFMFGEDRFSAAENFGHTYRQHGGTVLSDYAVNSAIRTTYEVLARDYHDPNKWECFPDVHEVLVNDTAIPATEIPLLVEVFADHERGTISKEYADALSDLAAHFELGLVANIWAPKEGWLKELQQAGVLGLFDTTVFSSDHSFIKPSAKIFDHALEALQCDRAHVLHIGDSFCYDVEGASAVGIDTMWINRQAFQAGKPPPLATYVVPDLLYVTSRLGSFRDEYL